MNRHHSELCGVKFCSIATQRRTIGPHAANALGPDVGDIQAAIGPHRDSAGSVQLGLGRQAAISRKAADVRPCPRGNDRTHSCGAAFVAIPEIQRPAPATS